ncbi:MAG: cell division GTPase [Halonotius sp. J07HN4]|nr:MAG: cell division GTPase [Halonotius sp. J07HN4]
MKLSLFGVGDAGTRLLNEFVQGEADTGRNFTNGNVLAFNTAAEAFGEATVIPEERQILIGDTHPEVNQYVDPENDDPESAPGEGEAAPSEGSTAPGVDGDPDLGATIAGDELPEIRRALDLVDDTEVDAAMLIVGLGGGTGAGVGSVLLEELKSIYESPIYVLGVLPASTESDQRALTAARALRTFVPMADAVLPVDNDAWRRDADPLAEQYDRINEAVTTRVLSLFAAGETEPESVSEMRIDPADMRRTLAVGGLASIGYSTVEVETDSDGLLASLWRLLGLADETPDTKTDAATIKRLVRRALESKLTLPCDITSADRVLLILSGPPGDISRKGFETGRYLLEQETTTVEVLAGDEPVPSASTITATVLLSNVTDVPRIDELQRRGVDHLPDTETASESGSTTDGNSEDHGFEFRDGGVDPDEAEPATESDADSTDGAAGSDAGSAAAADEVIDDDADEAATADAADNEVADGDESVESKPATADSE